MRVWLCVCECVSVDLGSRHRREHTRSMEAKPRRTKRPAEPLAKQGQKKQAAQDKGRAKALERWTGHGHVCVVCEWDLWQEDVVLEITNQREKNAIVFDYMWMCAPSPDDPREPHEMWDAGFCGRMCCKNSECTDKLIARQANNAPCRQCFQCFARVQNVPTEYTFD